MLDTAPRYIVELVKSTRMACQACDEGLAVVSVTDTTLPALYRDGEYSDTCYCPRCWKNLLLSKGPAPC